MELINLLSSCLFVFKAIIFTVVVAEKMVRANRQDRVRLPVEWCLEYFTNYGLNEWIKARKGWVSWSAK